jgi:hypothetical protein
VPANSLFDARVHERKPGANAPAEWLSHNFFNRIEMAAAWRVSKAK